jgi:glycolate oxidase iron-sulfur subunit
VLAAEGYEVVAPAEPRCCGALGLHAGRDDEARSLARQTIEAFEDCDFLVTNAAGCGSAGVYNLLEPEPAAELGRRKAELLLATGARVVAAGNPGCALQIAAHAEALGQTLEVVHPIELVARSIAGGKAATR